MIVKIKVSRLNEILDIITKFVSKHSTLPILENVYIKWSIDSLIFKATDMEKYIEFEIPASIDSDALITVNAKTFSDVVKTIEEDEIELIIQDWKDILKIKTKNDEFVVKWIDANEYVAIPELKSNNEYIFNAYEFLNWISKNEFSIAERTFSPVLTWLYMRIKQIDWQNKLIFVWTDSYRLSEYRVNFEWNSNELSVIIPKLNILEIKKVVDYFILKWWEELKINISDNLISFSFEINSEKISITSLLIQWTFPDYENESIIPTQFNTKFDIDKKELEKAIKKVSIFTRDLNNFVEFIIESNKLTIYSWETEKWVWKAQVEIHQTWENVEFWVNWKFLLDYLRIINWDTININIVNSSKPIVLKSKDDTNYTYIVRPIAK